MNYDTNKDGGDYLKGLIANQREFERELKRLAAKRLAAKTSK